jgi:hypothetical protein
MVSFLSVLMLSYSRPADVGFLSPVTSAIIVLRFPCGIYSLCSSSVVWLNVASYYVSEYVSVLVCVCVCVCDCVFIYKVIR